MAWTEDGKEIVCQDQGKLNVVDVDQSKVVQTFCSSPTIDSDEETDIIYAFAVDPKKTKLATAHKSGLLKLWNKVDGSLLGAWKSIHHGPIARLLFDSKAELIASGGCDSSVRIWDFEMKICTANLRGSQGVVSTLAFQNTDGNLIFAAGDDNKINGWDLESRELVMALEGHFAKVTSICCTQDGKYLVTTSRDRVVILWDVGLRKSLKVCGQIRSFE